MGKGRIAVLTSGGDCCGLNAVIEAIVRSALKEGYETIGYINGYDGLYNNEYITFDKDTVRYIGRRGGSIIGCSNRTNLFNHRVVVDGEVKYVDDSAQAIKNIKDDNVEALVIIGGDGSMTSARDFMRAGVNVICVPKTIDNDVPYTDQTFGYSSAVYEIAHALECIKTTGHSHSRVMILEVMGRHAGWLALEGGIAGSADIILIPEVDFTIQNVVNKIIERFKNGHTSTTICVSEGASPKGEEISATENKDYPDSVKLGGIGAKLAYAIEKELMPITGQEVRSTNLGYVQRGGETNYYDRVLSYRYGSYAVRAIVEKDYGKMVSLRGEHIKMIPLVDVVGNGPIGETSKGGAKNVNLDCDLLRCAKDIDIYFGD